MKKIILITLLIIAGFFGWRYSTKPDRKPTVPEQAINAAADYVPNAIDRKNTMENNINDSVAKENAHLQQSLNEIK